MKEYKNQEKSKRNKIILHVVFLIVRVITILLFEWMQVNKQLQETR